MGPAASPPVPRTLAFLGALFILVFFFLFSYSGLFAYFTFDDGTAVVANLGHFETSMWSNLLNILTVFTTAYRPLATLFWRPLYAIFGYNPLPYRIAVHLLLVLNIGLAYLLAKRLEATREAAALTALVFCYNASMRDLYYDTCTVTDVICFSLYVLSALVYVRGRQSGNPLGWRRSIAVFGFYLLALDSKELAVALPGVLSIYELLYRRSDFRERHKAVRVGGFLAAMLVVGALYLKVKVAEMSQNADYAPHVTFVFVLQNIGHYLNELLYLREHSVTPVIGCLILAGLIALAALVRSRQAIFGALFFIVALIPVAVIPPRGGYCAYIPYFGLSLAAGAILAGARRTLISRVGRKDLETATAMALFLCTAFLLGKAHMVHWMPFNGAFEWSNPQVVGLMEGFHRTIPEFPPDARVLLADDPWGPDWGPMFLVRLMYHDKTVWVDRTKNMDRPPDLASYDLVVSYHPPYVDLSPPRLFKIRLKWQTRGKARDAGQFLVSSPNAHGAASRIDFAPQTVKCREMTTVTIPGLSNVPVSALYRIVTGTKSTLQLEKNWCTLDARGSCTVTAPSAGAMTIDWIRPANQRWIFTKGILKIVE